jgi:hypothetical protein
MRVRRQLDALEPMILDAVEPVLAEAWHRAPNGKWSLAQIVSHLAIGMDIVSGVLEKRVERTDMRRRATPKQQLLRHLALGMGKLPSAGKVPKATYPDERPDPELVTAQFRIGVERFAAIVEHWPTERQQTIFAAHPILGDLNPPEWVRFFYLHCRYHRHGIEVRLRWLKVAST